MGIEIEHVHHIVSGEDDDRDINSASECEALCCELVNDGCNIAAYQKTADSEDYTCWTANCPVEEGLSGCISQCTGCGHVSYIPATIPPITDETADDESAASAETSSAESAETIESSEEIGLIQAADIQPVNTETADVESTDQSADVQSADTESADTESVNPQIEPSIPTDAVLTQEEAENAWDEVIDEFEDVIEEIANSTEELIYRDDDDLHNNTIILNTTSADVWDKQELVRTGLTKQHAITLGSIVVIIILGVIAIFIVRKVRSTYAQMDYRKLADGPQSMYGSGGNEKEPLCRDDGTSYVD